MGVDVLLLSYHLRAPHLGEVDEQQSVGSLRDEIDHVPRVVLLDYSFEGSKVTALQDIQFLVTPVA